MYIIINEREHEEERERERERARERERERERESERETEYKNQAKKITPTIFPFVDSGPISLGFSRESPGRDMWGFVAYVYNGGLVSLIHTLLGAKSLLSVIAV